MVQQILIRRGLASLWTSVNPVLGLGERGIETDTNKEKSGDGVTAWNSLPYIAGSGGGGVAVSAGAASISSGTVVFSNSNGVTFGMAGSTVTASVAAGGGGGSVVFSGGVSSASLTNIVFSNSNGVSFGLNGSTMTGSVVQSNQTQSNIAGVYDGVASISTGTIRFSNSNGVSFGVNGQTITASFSQSVQTQSNIAAVYDGTNSISTGTLRFSNANGVSFGINGQTVTGSIAIALNSLTAFAVSNTTNSSSGTLPQSAISIGGYGMVSVGISNGTVQISAPDTTSFAPFAVAMTNSGNTAGNSGSATGSAYFFGTNGITLSGATNASNISISIAGGGVTLSHYDWPPMQLASITSVQQSNGSHSVQYWPVYAAVSGTRLDIPLYVTAPNVANANTAAIAFSAMAVIYSLTGSTLSPIVGASNSVTMSWASNSSGYSQFTGNKYLSFAIATLLTPGEYWVGVNMSTTSGLSVGTATTALNASFNLLCGVGSFGGFNGWADFGSISNNNSGPLLRGIVGSVPTNTSQTLQSSQLAQGVGADAKANFVAVLRNY